MKEHGTKLAFIIIMFVVLAVSCPKGFDAASTTKESLDKKSEMFLITEDWLQEPIYYAPSRFIDGKNISFVALQEQDSVIIFIPQQKISIKQYHTWVGKSTGAYELLSQ